MPDLINEIPVGGGEGLRGNSEGIEIGSFQYLKSEDQINDWEEWHSIPTPDILKASPPGAFLLAKVVFPLFHDRSARATGRYPIQAKPEAAENLWGRDLEQMIAHPW
jgi:hypothetical protein